MIPRPSARHRAALFLTAVSTERALQRRVCLVAVGPIVSNRDFYVVNKRQHFSSAVARGNAAAGK